MDTYLLTGKPDNEGGGGFDTVSYRDALDRIARDGFAEDEWTMWDSKSQSGDQVVLYRAGRKRAGLIGFGARREGEPTHRQGAKGKNSEYPVTFCNLRSLDDDPYLSRQALRKYGFRRRDNLRRGGLKLDENLLRALENCCMAELGVSLSHLCSCHLGRKTAPP